MGLIIIPLKSIQGEDTVVYVEGVWGGNHNCSIFTTKANKINLLKKLVRKNIHLFYNLKNNNKSVAS